MKNLKEYIIARNIWILGGDGWAYDIGFGGIDHILSTNDNAKTKQAGNNGKKAKTSKFDINWIPETVSAYFKHIGVASKTYNND